jgi:2-dehydro-3-deoxy-D-arabinonate dehydratase
MSGSLKLYRTAAGPVLEADGVVVAMEEEWDALVNRPALAQHLRRAAARGRPGKAPAEPLLAPCDGQEIWGAGVTYDRSRTARIDESQAAGGGGASFYDRVYEAVRPELFFKCAAWRARGSGQPVRIRRDAKWSVPEPELVVCANARGEIVGCTIGDDLSARDIEAENPLYLPQAKIWDGACALGPVLLVQEEPLPPDTSIALRVVRAGAAAYEGSTTLARMRRPLKELVAYLYRETSFPAGCLLFTGTGIVPPDGFSLRSGDEIEITVPEIGTLHNRVE